MTDLQALVLRPGDRVLVGLPDSLRMNDFEGMANQLRERFPGVEFTFVAATGLAVQRKEEPV